MNTNRVLPVIVALFLVATASFAASAVGLEQEEMVVGGGGPGLGLWYPSFEGLNDALTGAGESTQFDTPIVLFGGGGGAGTVPGWSFGGFGGGTTVTEANAELSVGMGGVVLRHSKALGRGYWYTGALVGFGGADLIINSDQTSTTVEDAIANAGQVNLSSNFFALGPQVGVSWPIARVVRLQASAGYMLAFGGHWRQAGGDRELAGGKIDWSGPYLQLGIIFGGTN